MPVLLGSIDDPRFDPPLFTRSQLMKKSRQSLIAWLEWNDPNGVYNDKDSMREFGEKLTKDEAIEIILRQQLG